MDGLPNEWETRYFGGSTNADSHAMAANGRNTIREAYVAGLDPTNAQSVFAVSGIRNTLEWNAVSGRVYSVYWTTNLLEGFQPLQTNILWPQNSWTGQPDHAGAFYRLKVEVRP